MTFTAFLLILSSVVLHALWHFISKSQKPHYGFFLVFSFSIFVMMSPFLVFSGISLSSIPSKVWLLMFCGGFSGMMCDVGLSYAYRYAEISQAYPMARALPVVMTAVITLIFGFGRPLGMYALLGMSVIFAGCVIMPLRSWSALKLSSYCNKGMYGILLAACGTTAYTIIDGFGIKGMLEFTGETHRIAGAGVYSCCREFFVLCTLLPVSFLTTGERKYLHFDLMKHIQPYAAGFFAGGAYLLVLISMGFVTNVSYVQAFRQMSLPIGVFLGVFILKEHVTYQKVTAILLILGGLAAVYLLQ